MAGKHSSTGSKSSSDRKSDKSKSSLEKKAEDPLKIIIQAPQKANGQKKRQTATKRAGIIFPVARMHKQLKRGRYAPKIQRGAAIYLASVLEYLTAEILELSNEAAETNKRKRITPRYIQLGIRNDNELDVLLKNVTIAEGGVVPNIHKSLLPKPSAYHKKPLIENGAYSCSAIP